MSTPARILYCSSRQVLYYVQRLLGSDERLRCSLSFLQSLCFHEQYILRNSDSTGLSSRPAAGPAASLQGLLLQTIVFFSLQFFLFSLPHIIFSLPVVDFSPHPSPQFFSTIFYPYWSAFLLRRYIHPFGLYKRSLPVQPVHTSPPCPPCPPPTPHPTQPRQPHHVPT